jgi:hypothetical protein
LCIGGRCCKAQTGQRAQSPKGKAAWFTERTGAPFVLEAVTEYDVRNPEVDLITAVIFLGHSRLDTMARYSQPSAEDLVEAAEQLGRGLDE